ncbi:FAD-dependent oxidoreductase [Actinoplanes sp. OR16]|uniref:FAD-dependent monooxygenase n=1 Tax=Actinoplanes sp. OR16 TaxID=946334 RepID=UPI000F705B88|nr:FAD-dependent monooxygenase [Actinoplanes sp. OR16]BBH68903.1 FAD-dependent oxidoreductase [Actinoplanes sp. OR16]
MTAVDTVLVVGAGVSGAATAIRLAEGGVTVDLIDLRPSPPAIGSGITLQGNALRVLRELGVWERLRQHGYGFDTLGIRAPDPDGTVLAEVTDIRTGGPDLPATFGTYRPVLARILLDRAAAAGARIRYGTELVSLEQDGTSVAVTFADGATGRYDLVVGADGLHSRTRAAAGMAVTTRDLGMEIWRVVAPRPASVTRTDLFLGGPLYIAGYCPTGDRTLYAYLVEPPRGRGDLTLGEQLSVVRELTADYHGPWDEIRAALPDAGPVNFTTFRTHLLDPPWNRGRVVVIGDAAHAFPPTLAQGAAQSLEDASVLTELLLAHDTLTADLWAEFTERRYDRVSTVLAASLQQCQWLLDGVRGDVPGLHNRVAELVTRPA